MESYIPKSLKSDFWQSALSVFGRIGQTKLTPAYAFIMDTREIMGRLLGQTIRTDVTDQINRENQLITRIEEQIGFGNFVNRNELVVYFPAQSINRLEGYYLIKLGCYSHGKTGAVLLVDYLRLQKRGSDWVLMLRGKCNGLLEIQLLYTRVPEMRRMWLPESTNRNGMEPVDFLYAYSLSGFFSPFVTFEPINDWRPITTPIHRDSFADAVQLDWCQSLLEICNDLFAAPEGAFIWVRSWITNEIIRELIGKVGLQWRSRLLIITDQGMKIPVGERDFIPRLRQKIALKNNDGSFLGAEVWIGVDEI